MSEMKRDESRGESGNGIKGSGSGAGSNSAAAGSASDSVAVERPMTNRRMFFRMLFSAVFRRRSRAMMAVVASLVGAATLFCLAAICVAVPQQMNEEMRAYGANLIVTPTQRTVGGETVDGSESASGTKNGVSGSNSALNGSDNAVNDTEATDAASSGFSKQTISTLDKTVAATGAEHSAAYRYENTRINSLPFVVAGIDPHDVKALNHHWSVEGKWPSASGVLLGRDAASKLDAKIGSVITIKYSPGKSPVASAESGSGSGSSSGSGSESGSGSQSSEWQGGGSSDSSSGNSSGHDMSNMKGMKMSDSAHGTSANNMSDATVKDKLGNALGAIADRAKEPDMPGMNMQGGMQDMQGMRHGRQSAYRVGPQVGEDNGPNGVVLNDGVSYSDGSGQADIVLRTDVDADAGIAQRDASASGSVALAEWKPTAPNAGGMEFRVDGIVDTGGSEDDMVYANTSDVSKLTGFNRGADVVEFSVDASDAGLGTLANRINKATALNAKAQKVTKITTSNVRIITMLQTLFWIVTVVVLVLTLVGVGTTISSIVSQRRNEIGLRKALGASSRDIAVEFTVEAALYGLLGGLLGTAIGYLLARALSASVFGQTLSLNWPLALGSVVVSMLVAVLASLPPVRNAVRIDPAIVLQEE